MGVKGSHIRETEERREALTKATRTRTVLPQQAATYRDFNRPGIELFILKNKGKNNLSPSVLEVS